MKPREPRTTVELPARIRWEGRWISATIRNISPHGLMLDAANPPPPGKYVEVHVFFDVITARSVWSDDQRCGFQTLEVLNITQLAGPSGVAAKASSVVMRSDFGKRALQHEASPAVQSEHNRQFGHVMQFATMGVLSVIVAGGLGWEVFQTIHAPVVVIEHSLGS